jgi:hypothetical protein
VHRASIVDDEFIRRTSSSLTVGERLVFSGTEISSFANAAIDAGCALLKVVDAALT